MSARCAVCGVAGVAREFELASGGRLGSFCPGECFELGWEAHWISATGGDEQQRAEILWRWRARRAEVEGAAFRAPFPKSPAERQIERWVAELPDQDIVRELT